MGAHLNQQAAGLRILPYREEDPNAPVVRLVPYDPRSVMVAAAVADLVRDRIPRAVVEHIGSTAVPGCDGKGIVDLMIVTPTEERATLVSELLALGFQRQTGGFIHPPERPMLEGALDLDGDLFRIHLHVVPENTEERIVRRFRDVLRARAELRDEYVVLKRQIIESGVTERLEYTQRKNRFVEKLLEGGNGPPS